MKKVLSIILILVTFLSLNTKVYAKNTLGDLKNELQKLINQKAANEAEKNQTQSQINANNTAITNAHAEVEQAKVDIEIAKNKITDSNNQIEKVKAESAKLLVFYELTMDDDTFTNYIGAATNVTELIMRSEDISQILKYNQGKLKNLEDLIHQNEQLQVDLAKKQEDLNNKIVVYEQSVASLKNNLAALVEVTLDIDQEIQAQRELINYYTSIGCKDDQDLDECTKAEVTARWMKPTSQGYISSGFGWRSFYLNGAPYSDYHPGVDVANAGAQAPVYSVSNGTVAAVIYHSSCGGNQVFVHSYDTSGQKYTLQYAHLYSVNVKVGDKVNQQTVVGTVGGGGASIVSGGGWDACSTGWHLHFTMAKGYYLGGACSSCYSNFNTFIANSIEPPFMPKFGQAYYSRY